MSPLRQRLIEDLKIRHYSPKTVQLYVRHVAQLAAYFRRSPEQLGAEEIRRFLVYLTEEKRVAPSTLNLAVCALRFFYRVTLGRESVVERVPYAKSGRRLPVVLSREEMVRFLEALDGPINRVALMLTYSAGLRVSEVVQLQVEDIDSARMLIRIRQAKGRKDRYVPLSPILLDLLRHYWRLCRAKTWLFPGQKPGHYLSARTLQRACRRAAETAGLRKRVTPHVLRHSFATHLLELGTDVRTIQMLLGHRSLQTTVLYMHVTPAHIRRTGSPLDVLKLEPTQPDPGEMDNDPASKQAENDRPDDENDGAAAVGVGR